MVGLQAPASAPPGGWKQSIRIATRLLTAGAAALVIWTVASDVRLKRRVEQEGREAARAKAAEAAAAIDAELKAIQPVVVSLADDLSNGRLTPQNISARVGADLAAH